MAKSCGKGYIILTSSMAGSRVSDTGSEVHGGVYAASKAGADMLMKYAATEASTRVRFREYDVRSNIVTFRAGRRGRAYRLLEYASMSYTAELRDM